MFRKNNKKSETSGKPDGRTTTVTFTADDLAALGRLTAAGRVMLQSTHPVVTKLKAAMSRLGIATPQGL